MIFTLLRKRHTYFLFSSAVFSCQIRSQPYRWFSMRYPMTQFKFHGDNIPVSQAKETPCDIFSVKHDKQVAQSYLPTCLALCMFVLFCCDHMCLFIVWILLLLRHNFIFLAQCGVSMWYIFRIIIYFMCVKHAQGIWNN